MKIQNKELPHVHQSGRKDLPIGQGGFVCICTVLTTSVTYTVLMFMAFLQFCLSAAGLDNMLRISYLNISHNHFLYLSTLLVPENTVVHLIGSIWSHVNPSSSASWLLKLHKCAWQTSRLFIINLINTLVW